MPTFLESALRHEARKKGLAGEHADHYVYGAMNRIGAMHGNQLTAKGAAMEAKHERDLKASKPRRRKIRVRINRNLIPVI